MRALSALMTVVFTGFVLVQYNDPDALLWILLYGLAVAASAARVLGRSPVGLPLLVGVYSLAMLWLSPGLLQRDWIDFEEGRESAGLLIAAVWFAVLFVDKRRRAARPPR